MLSLSFYFHFNDTDDRFVIYIISGYWIYVTRCHWWLKLEQAIYWLNTEPRKIIRLVSHFIKVYLCREKHFIWIMHIGMCFTGRLGRKVSFIEIIRVYLCMHVFQRIWYGYPVDLLFLCLTLIKLHINSDQFIL